MHVNGFFIPESVLFIIILQCGNYTDSAQLVFGILWDNKLLCSFLVSLPPAFMYEEGKHKSCLWKPISGDVYENHSIAICWMLPKYVSWSDEDVVCHERRVRALTTAIKNHKSNLSENLLWLCYMLAEKLSFPSRCLITDVYGRIYNETIASLSF